LGNPLWGWWGDRRGKLSLMRGIAIARTGPPIALLLLLLIPVPAEAVAPILLVVFFVLGALANGLTIAVIGLLMEISPDDRRPAYSGYFNALTAPAFVLPLVGGFAVAALGAWIVFATALAAAIGQAMFLVRIDMKK
jgi:MFS family permease